MTSPELPIAVRLGEALLSRRRSALHTKAAGTDKGGGREAARETRPHTTRHHRAQVRSSSRRHSISPTHVTDLQRTGTGVHGRVERSEMPTSRRCG